MRNIHLYTPSFKEMNVLYEHTYRGLNIAPQVYVCFHTVYIQGCMKVCLPPMNSGVVEVSSNE